MTVELISIGDELLIGQTVNTNAAWLGNQLAAMGAKITKTVTVPDQKNPILRAIQAIESDLCIVTGGLGPTNDDITKKLLADYFEMELVLHPPTLAHIEAFFSKRNRPMLPANIDQAKLPKGCEILPNRYGTAAGMWFTHEGKHIISLPGVPYEMKDIFDQEIRQRITERFQVNEMYHRTVLTHGIGESFLAQTIADWENALLADGLSLAYLPSPGLVKLRVSSPKGISEQAKVEHYLNALKSIIPKELFGVEQQTMAEVVGQSLKEQEKTIGTVESCTAGNLAAAMVEIPGSSDYFRGSLLTYQTLLKTELLDIPEDFIAANDVVSEAVAIRMAEAGRNKLSTDYCLSTTGIMGPSQGDSKDQVGTVWVGLSGPDGVMAKCFHFGDNRARNIEMTKLAALNLFSLTLLEENS